ncbi:MAG: non-canonical purine NTP pyrophosphatase [Vicinamibacterales bacterium]
MTAAAPPARSRVVIATRNPGKVDEFTHLLRGTPCDIVMLDAGSPLAEPEESGETFAANARLKALYYAAHTTDLVVADDSGLEIEALQGWPGVRTARVPGVTYPEKWAEVYRRLDSRGDRASAARFVCAIAVAEAGAILFEAVGHVDGRVSPVPRGSGGFGYDPIFFYPPYGRTLAEISPDDKSRVSHRARAVDELRTYLAERFGGR